MTQEEQIPRCVRCGGTVGKIQVWDRYPSDHKELADCIAELIRQRDAARSAVAEEQREEREACAVIVEDSRIWPDSSHNTIAAAIRARGKEGEQ